MKHIEMLLANFEMKLNLNWSFYLHMEFMVNFMKGIQIVIDLPWIHDHLASGYEFSCSLLVMLDFIHYINIL